MSLFFLFSFVVRYLLWAVIFLFLLCYIALEMRLRVVLPGNIWIFSLPDWGFVRFAGMHATSRKNLPSETDGIIVVIIQSFYSLWNIGHPWSASKCCDLQPSPWPHSMTLLCFLFHPLLSLATFSSPYLFFYTPEDSSLMGFFFYCPCFFT